MSDPSRIVRRMFDEVMNGRRFDVLDEILSAEYVEHAPIGDLHGVGAYRAFLEAWYAAFPDARAEAFNVIVQDDRAAWMYRFTGTHTGALMGIPPTGRRIDVVGVNMGVFRDGRATEHWTGNELFTLLQQLGLMPSFSP